MAASVVACYAEPQLETIADTADGAFVPASASTYMRYQQRCKLLWRVDPAGFERYERFLGRLTTCSDRLLRNKSSKEQQAP
jgi:hypothetical protein